jgi:hypothetical protein
MKLEDFIVEWKPVWSQPRDHTIEMERRWCACHCREVWVPKEEPAPYFCSDNRKMLPAGNVGLEAATI